MQLVAGDSHAEFVPSYHRDLVLGVATYARELFAAGTFDVVYVPIGQGSGISGVIAVRDLLQLPTEVVAVVPERFPVWAQAFASRGAAEAAPSTSLADGMACRITDPHSLPIVLDGVARMIIVSEEAIADAMRDIFTDTHNVAEGAGAAPVAAVAAESERLRGKRVAAILSGGNVDAATFAGLLANRQERAASR